MCAAFQGFIKDLRSTSVDPCSMATGTDFKAHLAGLAALIGVAAMPPVRWRAGAERVWSYGVYYVGFRLLSVTWTALRGRARI